MKKFICLGFFCAMLLFALSSETFAQCDGDRWAVKIGTDSDASLVNMNSATATTIASMSSLPVPTTLLNDARVQPTETTTWVINATLVKYMRSYDSDYHLVFKDGAGRTMIGEIPSPECVSASSPFAAGIRHARAQLEAALTATTTMQSANIPVQITGIGFFDYNEGQEGIAANGIELHPIIDIVFGQTQQILGNPGFENGSANPSPWTVSAGVIDNSAGQAALTGAWKAWLNGYGSAHTDTLAQQVNIPPAATSVRLSFWLHIDTAETTKTKANDTLKVQLRNSSGAVLSTLATYSNLNASAGYSQFSFDLTAYKGQAIQIYLVGAENSTLKTSFVADDFALNVVSESATATPDFAITASPLDMTLTAGNSGSSTISTAISGNFNSEITLSAAGLPNNVTANFSQSFIAAPGAGSSTLTISAGSAATPGTYNIIVTGSGGGFTHSVALNLTVAGSKTIQQIIGNPGFENGATNPTPWSVTNGVIDNSSYQAAHSGVWKAWLNGYGSVHTDTIYQQVSIPATATAATLSFWRHIDTDEKTTSTAYDTLKIQIRNSSGAVLTTLATYSNLNAAAGYTQSSFDLSAYKGQTIQIYLIGTEDSTLKTSFVIDDFSLNVETPS